MGLFNLLPLWEETAHRCLNCGVCTFLCPTCYCFDTYDELDILGKNQEEDMLREALAREPDHVGSLTNLGTVLLEQMRYDEALPVLERAHELDPGSHRILGLVTIARQGPRRP